MSLMKWSREHVTFILIISVLLGIGLRGYKLGYQSLWVDEVNTYLCASGSLLQIVNEAIVRTHILPLYYVIVRGVLMLSSWEIMLRVPSMIAGSLSIVLVYFVVRNWVGSNVALICAMICSISPIHIWYSQEARPYSLLLFLALLCMWLMQEALKRENNVFIKLGVVISAAATFYCHTVGIAFIAFIAVYLTINVERNKWKDWLPVFVSIALVVLPGIYLISEIPGESVGQLYRPFNSLYFGYTLWAFISGYSLGPSLAELHASERMSYLLSYLHIILPLMVLSSGLVVLGGLRLWKRDKVAFWSIASFFAFPLGFATVGSLVTEFYFNIRYTFIAFVPFIVFVALGVQSLQVNWLRILSLVMIGLTAVYSLGNYYFNERYHKDNNRVAGRFLSAHVLEGDLVICSAPYTIEGLKYYIDSPYEVDLVPYPADSTYVDASRLSGDLKEIVKGRKGFWLFLSRTYHSDPEGYIRGYCNRQFRRGLELKSSGVELIYYERK